MRAGDMAEPTEADGVTAPIAAGTGHVPEPTLGDALAAGADDPGPVRGTARPKPTPPETGHPAPTGWPALSTATGQCQTARGRHRSLLRRLRDPGGARPRGHGGRVQGAAGQPQPACRPQDDQGGSSGRRLRAESVPERGQGGRIARPFRDCAGLRGRRARRPAVLQHEAVDGGNLAERLASFQDDPRAPWP